MRAVLILLSAAIALFLASAFAQIAAFMARSGSPYADTVGCVGLAASAVVFVAMSIISWRTA